VTADVLSVFISAVKHLRKHIFILLLEFILTNEDTVHAKIRVLKLYIFTYCSNS